MSKYIYVVRTQIIRSLTYEFNVYGNIIMQTIIMITSAYFWRALYRNKETVGGVDAESMLTGVITGEMSTLASKTGVDEMLTSEKNTICARTMQNAQEVVDRLGLGVSITNIELTGIAPPPEAVEAFDNATTAAVRKQTLIQQANDYRESALPKAESDAQKLIDDARANQSSAVAKATSIAQEFNGLYGQFSANPDVVRNGVFRSRLAALIAKSGKTIVIPDGETGAPKVVLP